MTLLEAYLDVEERETRTIRSGTLLRLGRRVLVHWVPLSLGLGAIFVGTFAALMEPRLFGYAIDEAIVPHDWARLNQLTLIFFLVICVRIVGMIGQGYLFELLGQQVTQDLRCMLFSHLSRLRTSDLDRYPVGRLLTRVTNDVAAIGEMFSGGFVTMLSNALMIGGILVWLLALDLRLGLIAMSVFPLLLAVSVYFSIKLKIAYRESRSRLSALNAFLAENLLGMKVVHLFNRRFIHFSRFERLNQWYSDAQIATIRIFAFFQPSITLTAGLSMALVIWFGGKAAAEGTIKVGVLFAYFSYVLSLFQPVRELADKWNVFLSGMASAERIFSMLEWPVELTAREAESEALPISGLRGHIVFENVWFAYEGERWILRDLSFEIPAGHRIGVVGHTGAGKSTLISLLMRFYEPQKGRILLDGKDIREYDKRALRASIGVVQQDVFIFAGSFEDNIGFWGTQVGPSKTSAMAELGLVGEPLRRMNASSEQALLQEKGSNLSMGERQVLAFARARAAEPRIWILDEATANMDSGTEQVLQQSLNTASAGKTSIFIAHRLATVRTAHCILVLHRGSLVEKGTHQELMQKDGLYSRLYRYQAAGGSPPDSSLENSAENADGKLTSLNTADC
jgi:ATP-binding cassette subfamily B protein